jgi:hypothetical protein
VLRVAFIRTVIRRVPPGTAALAERGISRLPFLRSAGVTGPIEIGSPSWPPFASRSVAETCMLSPWVEKPPTWAASRTWARP